MPDQILDSILGAVGNTPLVRLQRLQGDTSNTILAKLEGNNPAGSVKDRPALAMIEAGEKAGTLTPDKTVIEATSGNQDAIEVTDGVDATFIGLKITTEQSFKMLARGGTATVIGDGNGLQASTCSPSSVSVASQRTSRPLRTRRLRPRPRLASIDPARHGGSRDRDPPGALPISGQCHPGPGQ